MLKLLRITVAASLLAFVMPASALQVCSHGMVSHGHGEMVTDGALTRSDFSLLGTSWDPGANTVRGNTGNIPAPGGATWSITGAGFVDGSGLGFGAGHAGATQAITSLGVAGWGVAQYAAMINDAMNVWAAASGFTNLGQVADGAVNIGQNGAAGATGDIRISAWEIISGNVLAHAFNPCNQGLCGTGGNIGGDLHMDVNRNWIDDPDGTIGGGFDIFTVMLHELGHSLGLGHTNVVGSIMEPIYAGTRRTLGADDIAGIQALYGAAAAVPAPGTLWLLGMGLLALGWSRRRS